MPRLLQLAQIGLPSHFILRPNGIKQVPLNGHRNGKRNKEGCHTSAELASHGRPARSARGVAFPLRVVATIASVRLKQTNRSVLRCMASIVEAYLFAFRHCPSVMVRDRK